MVAHDDQVRLQGDDGFYIDVGTHTGLEQLSLFLQAVRPLQDLGIRDAYLVDAQCF